MVGIYGGRAPEPSDGTALAAECDRVRLEDEARVREAQEDINRQLDLAEEAAEYAAEEHAVLDNCDDCDGAW